MRLGVIVVLLFLGLFSLGLVRGQNASLVYVVSVDVEETLGDMDGWLDAGERGRIEIVLGNALGYEARAVNGIISSSQSGVSMTDDDAWWPNIRNGSFERSRPNHMEVELSQDMGAPVVSMSILVRWMNPEGDWVSSTLNLSVPVNRGYDVDIDTDGSEHRPNEAILIKAKITGKLDGEPLLGAQVEMRVIQPSGLQGRSIPLMDDGEGDDEEAGDGVYVAGEHVVTGTLPGIHTVRVSYVKNDFQGVSSATFKVPNPSQVEVVWEKNIHCDGIPSIRRIVKTSDGGCLVVGSLVSASGSSNIHNRIYLCSIHENGEKAWSHVYGETGNDRAIGFDAVERPDGSYLVVGMTRSLVEGDFRIYLAALGPDGSVVWETCPGRGIDDHGTVHLVSTSDGGCIAAGTKERIDDIYLVKVDHDGQVVWERTIGDSCCGIPNPEYQVTGITETDTGGWAVVGKADGYMFRMEFDDDGNTSPPEVRTIEPSLDRGGLSLGSTTQLGGDQDVKLVFKDRDGGVVWEYYFDTPKDRAGKCLTPYKGDEYVLAIVGTMYNFRRYDYILVRVKIPEPAYIILIATIMGSLGNLMHTNGTRKAGGIHRPESL